MKKTITILFIILFSFFNNAIAQGTVTFAALGDFGVNTTNATNVSTLVKNLDPDLIITCGDNNYIGSTTANWDNAAGNKYADYIHYPAGSSSAYAPGATINAFFPSYGNHDMDYGAASQANYFELPGNERYYTFIQGPVQFFAINSDSREADGITSSSTQGQWLKAQLAASTATWKVVYFHHAAYTSGSNHPPTTAMQWPFEQWGADVVLQAHNHHYERIHRDDNSDGKIVPYFVTGAGGNGLYSFTTPITGSQVRYNGNYGTMYVEANSTTMTFYFYAIPSPGTLIDSYTITKSESNPTLTFQDGINGYAGTSDTYILQSSASSSFGTETTFGWDTEETNGNANTKKYAMLRFDNIFGSGAGQIPEGSTIISAEVQFYVSNTGNNANAYESIVDWTESETWNSFGGDAGIQTDEYNPAAVSTVIANTTGLHTFDVTSSLAAWVSNPSLNKGWIILPGGNDGIDASSSENSTVANRPLLRITYDPTPPTMPADPSNLVAAALIDGTIQLTWNDNSTDESGFQIERSTDGGSTFALHGTVGADVNTFLSCGLSSNTEYCYRVRAYNGSLYSGYTNVDCATTPILFQEGVSPYTGTSDTYIMENSPSSSYGSQTTFGWDSEEVPGNPATRKIGLIRFDNIFGSGAGQIPVGSSITSARVEYNVSNTGNDANVYESLADWNESVTWNTFGGDAGVSADEYNPSAVSNANGRATGVRSFNVTTSIASWSSNPTANYGWIIIPDSSDGVDAASSENGTTANRPVLRVLYNALPPVPPADPSDLTAALGVEEDEILLSWSDNSNNELGFQIEKSTDGGLTFALNGSVGVNIESFTSSGLELNKEYCYRVRAYNSSFNSGYTNVACATTPRPPFILVYPADGQEISSYPNMVVTVSDGTSYPLNVEYYIRESGAPSFNLLTTVNNVPNGTNASFFNINLESSKDYEWYVQSINPSLEPEIETYGEWGTGWTAGGEDSDMRIKINANSLTQNGVKIRIKVAAPSDEPLVLANAFIGEKAATGDDYDMQSGTIKQITFNGGATGLSLTTNQIFWSDYIDYSFDKSKIYYISFGHTSYIKVWSGGSGCYVGYDVSKAGVADVNGYTDMGGMVGTMQAFEITTTSGNIQVSPIWSFSTSSDPLPVELTTFSGKYVNKKIVLNWTTKTEINNFGFEVEKSAKNGTSINWEKIGFVRGHDNSNSPKDYSFADNNIDGGNKYVYRLKQIDTDGMFQYSEKVEIAVIPTEYILNQNYPNPFNPTTTISYTLPFDSEIKLVILNTLGETIEVVEDNSKSAGLYEINLNAGNLSSGIYFYSLITKSNDAKIEFRSVKKMLLLK